MMTPRITDSALAPLSPGVLPYAPGLRTALAVWQQNGIGMPAPQRLVSAGWQRIADQGVAFDVLYGGGDRPHGFRAMGFGRQLQRDLGVEGGPRLFSAEAPVSFWLNLTVDAKAPLLAYGALEPIGAVHRRGEMLFLPLGQDRRVETVLAVVAPSAARSGAVVRALSESDARIRA
jgi:hypothetical protein